MSHVSKEPTDYKFRDVNGHHGKEFKVNSALIDALIIECDDEMTVTLQEKEVERLYYVISGNGYFIVDGVKEDVSSGDLVHLPNNSIFTFGGTLKMLLVDAPLWSPEQEIIHAR